MVWFWAAVLACAVNIVVKGFAPVVDWYARQRAAQAQECRRLCDDADYQTAAFSRGDLSTAHYGRYQPLHEPVATSGRRYP